MADEPEKSGQEPNLELPSLLGFGRKKKGRAADPALDEAATTGPDLTGPDTAGPDTTGPLAADPVAPPRGGLAPSAARAKRLPPVPPPTARKPPTPPPVERPVVQPIQQPVEHPDAHPVRDLAEETETERTQVIEPVLDPVAEPVAEPALDREPPDPEPEPEPEPQPEFEPEPEREPEAGAVPVLPIGRFTSPPSVDRSTAPQFTAPVYGDQSQVLEEPLERSVEEPDHRPPTVKPRVRSGRPRTLPVINPRIATAVTGALVGLTGVVLAFLTGRGCEEVRGVGSCGGIGLVALLLILAIEVFLGAAMLKAWRVYDPVSTSFLGVGLLAVFVLLFLLNSLESVWMLLVIPLISALTFLLSWWVTETFVEDSSGTR